jgi:hypothetical protein
LKQVRKGLLGCAASLQLGNSQECCSRGCGRVERRGERWLQLSPGASDPAAALFLSSLSTLLTSLPLCSSPASLSTHPTSSPPFLSLLVQGEGGLMHGETFKIRWFVLSRVPHATVLIYYDRKCMDEDHILGYIDMRRVVAVKEVSKAVHVDASRSSVTGLMHKMRNMFGSSTLEQVHRPVLEIVTNLRTFILCPATGDCPPPVSTAVATRPSLYGKPLYLFGWPFPVPFLDGAVMGASEEDVPDDEHSLAISTNEAQAAAQKLFNNSDPSVVSGGCCCCRAE